MEIKIKYLADIPKLEFIGGKNRSNWIDLRASEDVFIPKDEMRMIPLGIAMELPEGHEAHVLPRSSTFKKWGIILVNGMGIIDSSYCGSNDQWYFPAYCLDAKNAIGDDYDTVGTQIRKGDRIAQFRIMGNQPDIEFVEVDDLGNEDRGGFGSTGVQ